jgi:DNA-binding NarL/FixJ family response regulator
MAGAAPQVSERIRILIADDHHVVRQGLVALLKTIDGLEVVAEAADGWQAIDKFEEHRPDVTLMDLRMPKIGGVEAVTHIRSKYPQARIIVLTTFDGDEDIYRAIQAGAKGYLLKGMFGEELVDAIRAVHAGKTRIPSVIAERLADRMGGPALTNREMDVLKGIVAGQSNKEIGSHLSISEATVKTHINSILGKLGVTDRTQAATTALQRGIVHFPS